MRQLLLFAAAIGLAQPTASFIAADVHPSAPESSESGAFLPNGRVEFRDTTLLALISQAYSAPRERIAGGPSWLDTDKFDVTAQAPPHTGQPALRTMLQSLLAERFGFTIERQVKPVPAYLLTVAKEGVLKPHEPRGAPDCKRTTEDNIATLVCRNMTIASLAERLQLIAPGYFEVPLVDQTGLSGSYDFTLRYTGRGNLPPGSDRGGLSLYSAIEKQTGIHVERGTANLPVFAITGTVNRVPLPNPPGTAEKLGPTPTEFDVADIRPSRAEEDFNAKIENGRIDARAISLRDLIAYAYNVEPDWVRGEKWMERARFNIVAKTAPTEADDVLQVMLQNLLAQRFHLKVHNEPQPVTVYALTAVKSRLKDADPSTRATCKSAAAAGMRTFTCQNTTMAQLAEKLRDVAGGYVGHPVVDLTGLTGSYDFTLSWTPFAQMARRSADDASVAITLFEAVDRQLGLKLATQKYPMPVVVVDHVDRSPTEN